VFSEVVFTHPQAVPSVPATAGKPRIGYDGQSFRTQLIADMIELNPVRQRITDLTDRVLSLRGYL